MARCQECVIIYTYMYILSRASEVGSPINPPWAPGSDKTWGQGSFGLDKPPRAPASDKGPWSVSRRCPEPRWFIGDPTSRAHNNIYMCSSYCSYSNIVPLSDKYNLEKHYRRFESVCEGFWWMRGSLMRQPSPLASFWFIVFGCSRQVTKKILCLECHRIQYHVRIGVMFMIIG